ncbi:MAG: type IV secretion system DNA-binding domain-containing protein [Pseudomonadota bacterium]|jgi:hypothetical protein|nr:type IV secretion system DNA-binding domain-containing protein [Pseudomonadota bacterium]
MNNTSFQPMPAWLQAAQGLPSYPRAVPDWHQYERASAAVRLGERNNFTQAAMRLNADHEQLLVEQQQRHFAKEHPRARTHAEVQPPATRPAPTAKHSYHTVVQPPAPPARSPVTASRLLGIGAEYLIGPALLAAYFLTRRRRRSSAPAQTEAPAAPAVPDLDPRPARGTWLAREDGVTHHLVRPTLEQLKQRGVDPSTLVPLGNMYLWPKTEQLHTKIIGVPGSGKTTAINNMLAVIERRGDRVIISDFGGGYVSRFYRPERGDVILNPFDQRSAAWDLFADIRTEYDADASAAALVPEGHGDNAEWSRYAQQFVSACITALRASPQPPTVSELWRLVAMAPIAELRVALAGTPAAAFVEGGNEKMFGSVRSTAVGACKSLSYLAAQRADGRLSLTDYVGDDSRRGWLFLSYTSKQRSSLKGLIASELRAAISGVLERPEGDARIWFIVDELDALGKIDGLSDALARMRKHGGRCALAFQAVGQGEEVYGKNVFSVILETCGNSLILQCGGKGSEGTSAYASALLGKREVLKTTWATSKSRGENTGSSTTGGGGGSHSGQNWSDTEGSNTQYHVEDTVLPSQIEGLEPLHGLVKIGNMDLWSWCTLTINRIPQSQPAFVLAGGDDSSDTATPGSASPEPSKPPEAINLARLV